MTTRVTAAPGTLGRGPGVATAPRGHGDVTAARTLLRAVAEAGTPPLVLISIVGIDDLPLGLYRDKVVVGRLVRGSGAAFTILRATRFHSFVEWALTAPR